MGNLLDSLANVISNRVGQIAEDTVNTAIRRVERVAVDAIDSTAQQISNRISNATAGDNIYSGVVINQAGLSTPNPSSAAAKLLQGAIPQVLQPILRGITTSAINTVLDTTGKLFSKTAGAIIDVGSKTFQNNVSLDGYLGISSGLAAVANEVGIPTSKIGRIVNLTTPLVASGLRQAGDAVNRLLGTTELGSEQYNQYKNVAVGYVNNQFEESGLTQLGSIGATVGVVTSGMVQTTNLLPLDAGGAISSPVYDSTMIVTDIPPLDSGFSSSPITSNFNSATDFRDPNAFGSTSYNPIDPLPNMDHPPAPIGDWGAQTEGANGTILENRPDRGASGNASANASGSSLPGQISSMKVFLQSAYSANKDTIVMFDAQPRISITETADYDTLSPIHSVTGFVSFKTSHMKKISITDIRLFSRTPKEASANLKRLHILKSWLKPYFGQSGGGVDGASTVDNGNTTTTSMQRMLGAPPDILFLYAYSGATTSEQNLKQIPVVIDSLSYDYPNDIDYISTEVGGIPFPVIMTLSLTLLETHSPKEAEEFSLAQYKAGKMLTW